MGSTRIPISLKFDDSTDFYKEFVVGMRNDKSLAGFIVDILKAYHENESIREQVNEMLNIYDPLTEIKKQIERAQLEHNKTIMSASILSQHVSSATENLFNETPKGSQDYAESDVLSRVEAMEKSFSSIEEKLKFVLEKLSLGDGALTPSVLPTTTGQLDSRDGKFVNTLELDEDENESVHNSDIKLHSIEIDDSTTENLAHKSTGQSISPVVELFTPEINVAIRSQTTIEEPFIEIKPIISTEEVEIPIVVPMTPQSNAAPVITFSEEEQEVEEVSKRPSSFGKALKSLRK